MTVEQKLQDRSGSKCELCTSGSNLAVYNIPPDSDESADQSILLCDTCLGQIENPETVDANHWHCLNDSMWTPVPAVQVMAYRQLNGLKAEGWAQDLLEMLYLEDDVKVWAESGMEESSDSIDNEDEATVDSNGAKLDEGDTVTLIKDLVVKGANFTAKRGTVVKNISLTSNPKHIEGRVNGTRIVLVSAFLKKA
jgi:protein PhnA